MLNKPIVLSAKGKRVITLEDLLELHEIDKKLYEVIKFKANVWEGQQKDKNDEPVILQLHQVSAEIKPIRQIVEWRQTLLDVFNDHIQPINKKRIKQSDKVGVIPHFDLHIDKYPNDTLSYLETINQKTMELLELFKQQGVSKVLYINGGDYYNSDWKHKTSKGTEQHNTMSEKESFKIWLQHQIQLLDTIADKFPLEALYVSGNHDDLKNQALADAIDIYFSKNERVHINNDDSYRKYFERGDTTIGTGHGDGVKTTDLLSVFSQEQGLNKYNYYLKWHIHHELKQLFGNLLIQTFASPSNASERDKKMGYITNGKLLGQIYDKKDGKFAEFIR